MSILLKPDINPAKLSSVTLCAGLAVCTALKEDFGINAGIKWPNDIVVDGKKICGILTEMSGQMQKVDFVVVGIGINVNNESFPEEIQHKASSLYLLSGKKFKRSSIAKAVLNRFDKIYNRFEKEGFKPFKEEYEANLLRAYRHLDACRFKNKGWPCPTCPSCCFCGKDYETMTEVMDFVREWIKENPDKARLMKPPKSLHKH